jgi:ABC-type amino acid transport substrate-binding protein
MEGDSLEGISIDVLKYVAEYLDIDIKYERMPWPRVLKSLEHGHVDLVTTFFNTAERAPFVVYTGIPHTFESSVFVVPSKSEIVFDGNLNTIYPYRIGAIKGYSYGESFDNNEDLIVERVLDEPTLVRMIASGRYAIAIGNGFAIDLEAQRQGVSDNIKMLSTPVDSSPIYMAFSRQHEDALELSSRFTDAIAVLKKTEEYQGMLQKYDMQLGKF